MGNGPDDLFALCQEFLAACQDALDTIPSLAPGLGGSPERAFVSPGLPSFDCCDQLAVHAAAVFSDPLQPLKNQERRNMVTLVAHATRCIPVIDSSGNIPSAADMEAAAEQIDADGWALWNHLFNLIRAGSIFSLCRVVLWDGLRSINPQGGCGGWVLTLRLEYDGYDEAIST